MSADALSRALAASRRTVVFTGAGISTESGIADFRSPGGVWSRMAPIDYREFIASKEARRESWRRRLEMDAEFRQARPNRGHRAVAQLVARGTASCVVTQNIDGLHQQSGVPAEKLVELHGNTTYASCLACGRRLELAPLLETFAREQSAPICGDCGGLVKTATVSFGQPMPEAAMARARAAALACDLFLAVGSSLVVYPAAGLPRLARKAGATLAIVNREPTDLDDLADVVVRGEIGAVLGEAAGVA